MRKKNDMDQRFEIPVVVFMFKRVEKTVKIIDQIAKVKPRRIYLIADGARSKDEINVVLECRRQAESHINWECDIIKNYSDENRGVYNNIAGGAQWVFEQEKHAIFLEDDNLPEVTFFRFCEEMLYKYNNDTRILWICGTNYLKEYEPIDGSSYVFTHHMMPCGWASWSDKFLKFYDGEMKLFEDENVLSKIKLMYKNKSLYKQDLLNWSREKAKINMGLTPHSWDYQMSFCLRANNLLGIVPKYNQITNIGVDNDSIHGGSSFENVMVKRFCELPTKKILFPLIHPKVCLVDKIFEEKTGEIICTPRIFSVYNKIIDLFIHVFNIKNGEKFKETIKKNIFKIKNLMRL